MTRATLLAAAPPAPDPLGSCGDPGDRLPEWHVLRLFGAGRHQDRFEAGRERIGDL